MFGGRYNGVKTYRSEEFLQESGIRPVCAAPNAKAKNLALTQFWDTFFLLNRVKFQLMVLRCRTS